MRIVGKVKPMDLTLLLAAAAKCDQRTADRARREGAHVIRTRTVRENLVRASADLGIPLGPRTPSDLPPPRSAA